jgi:hypothetical protein
MGGAILRAEDLTVVEDDGAHRNRVQGPAHRARDRIDAAPVWTNPSL